MSTGCLIDEPHIELALQRVERGEATAADAKLLRDHIESQANLIRILQLDSDEPDPGGLFFV